MVPHPRPPASHESGAGLVRTCLQPAFLPSRSRENYSPVRALDFLKPDQRWDPAGSPSKISAMWSLGVSEVKLGTRREPIPGWGCRGQRPEGEWKPGAGGDWWGEACVRGVGVEVGVGGVGGTARPGASS